jgi:hypothetical protein
MGAGRASAEIDHRGPVMVMLMFVMMIMMRTIVMVMPVTIIVAMPMMMLVAMHGPIGVGVLVGLGLRRTFDRGFARRASANCTHQSTSSSLILSSSPEVICN